MATFNLTKGTDNFVFDTGGTGSVKKNGADFGTWSTGTDNKLVATPAIGGAVTFDAAWKFVNNELCIFNGATQLLNFHGDRRPRYELNNAVLTVHPDFVSPHSFSLHGEWDLETDMKLSFTPVGGAKSSIDGVLSDVHSRFIYRFASAAHPAHQGTLVFAGRWRRDPTDAAKLNFIYSREGGTEDTFVLPGTYAFNDDNQLIYKFDGATHSHSVTLVGTLRIGSDFQISYSISNQATGTEIVVNTVFENNSLTGSMQLSVSRPTGGKTTFTISGTFAALKKPGSRELTVGYAISGGGGNPMNVSINGSFKIDGGTVSFSFANGGGTTTIALTASQIRLGNFATADASAVIKLAGGQLQSVEFMFGVTFPAHQLAAAGTLPAHS